MDNAEPKKELSKNDLFDRWIEYKKIIHRTGRKWEYREREVWWCAIGENVGSEINGKGRNFLRPVLIVRKYGTLFFGVPLSSRMHDGIWYEHFRFKDKMQCALLSQAGSMCAFRLHDKIGKLSFLDYLRICDSLSKLILKK